MSISTRGPVSSPAGSSPAAPGELSPEIDSGQAFALFEDNLAAPGELVLFSQLQHSFSATAPDLQRTFDELVAASRAGLWLAVAADYELGFALEPRLAGNLPADRPVLRAWAFRQRTQIPPDSIEPWWQARLAPLSAQEREAGILHLTPGWSAQHHARCVGQILSLIANGDCYQVNLTFPLRGLAHGHPLALFARLRQTQPVRYGSLIHDGKDWILSRSPELFFALDGSRLTTKPMKGTIRRGRNPEEDARRLEALRTSAKDRAENLMIVDLIRNDLGRVAPIGGVHVERLFEVESYATLFQMTSTVIAEPIKASTAEILRAIFPCGSVTGAPKIRAMEIIDEIEEARRGLYCGALGWIAPDGGHRFSVPIRTLLIAENRSCRLDVGSGIVADSIAADEYEECLGKAAFARCLADEFDLIETILWQADGGLQLLERHLARLQHAAAALGFQFDRATIAARLARTTTSLPPHDHRVRLALTRTGECTIDCRPLDPLPTQPQVFVWPTPLDGADPKLRFKTTARHFYDDALRQATRAGCFDTLFVNRRGELCEGARSNVFLEIDGRLLTPPLQCGLLPGVYRQSVLDRGLAREAVLTEADLHRARRIFLSNALRGMIEVSLRATPGPNVLSA